MDSPQFSHVMSIPHRRPAYGVNGPAVFRHIGYRIEVSHANPLTAVTLEEVNERRITFVDQINEALSKIQTKCGSAQIYSFTAQEELAKDHVLPTLNTLLNSLDRLPPQLAAWRGRLRVDIHSEYYFVTFILDQKTTRETDHAMVRDEAQLSDVGCAGINLTDFVKTYYDQVWEDLDAYIAEGFGALPGRRFTEFRAIALRDRTSPFVKQRESTRDIPAIPEMNDNIFKDARASLRHWLHKNISCVSEILQLARFTKKADQDANCVLCEVLDGAGIYGSSVRLVDPQRQTDSSPQPLRYFLLYNGLSKYQLGRLVRRTYVMGELRVAAVMDARLLAKASWRIRSLGNRIDRLLQKEGGGATLSDVDRDAVAKEFNEISASVPGGLMYRVNRSRYYVKSFRERMSDMRVRRLEGWQPYDEFFSRNLYQVFDEIDRIGQRYEALAERITRLTISRNAEALNKFQGNIQALVGELTNTNRDVVSLLRLGDIVGGAAFTYYAGHVVEAIVTYAAALIKLSDHPPELALSLLSFALAFLGWMWLRTKILPEHGRATAAAPATTQRSAR